MQGVTRRNDREKEAVLFGAAVRRAREQRGLAQNIVADAAGISLTYFSLLERGENTPTLTIVFRICDTLEVSPSELLDGVWRQRYPVWKEIDGTTVETNGCRASVAEAIDRLDRRRSAPAILLGRAPCRPRDHCAGSRDNDEY
jgi:transcriptional regulator with XRE-family HTH domain